MKTPLLLLLAMSALSLTAQPLPLWQDVPPGRVTTAAEVCKDNHLYNVSCPTLEYFLLDKAAPVVLVAPGGGYQCLSYDKEGQEAARWLNTLGCHAVVLKYRIPGDRAGALMDAEEAVRVLKRDAAKHRFTRFGMIGFSAGAHLTASVIHKPQHGLDFALLVYPAYLSTDGVTLAPEVIPAKPHIPTFVAQARDDRAYVLASLGYAGYLLKANAPIDYHLYERGGHGQGLRYAAALPMSRWKQAAEAWLAPRVTQP